MGQKNIWTDSLPIYQSEQSPDGIEIVRELRETNKLLREIFFLLKKEEGFKEEDHSAKNNLYQ